MQDKPEFSAEGKRPSRRHEEMKIYGINACLAVFKYRPEAIIRAYLLEERIPVVADLLRFCAKERKAYHVVSVDDMKKISETEHHEGLCLLVRQSDPVLLAEHVRLADPVDAVLVLDRVSNPHNVGAIARVAAHFGTSAIIAQEDELFLGGAAYRIAEGGLEVVKIISVKSLERSLEVLKRGGYALLATSSYASISLFKHDLPARCAFLMGAESDGLQESLRCMADADVVIPGCGKVESLNVATAVAVLLGEHWRQRRV